MMDRIFRALEIGSACWKVLLRDKEMLLFPVMSTFAMICIFASGGWLIYSDPDLQTVLQTFLQEPNLEDDPRFWGAMFVFLFVNYFIAIFFNAALLTCALIRFAGGDPTVADGLRSSVSKLPQILLWALVATTVGWLLSLLESRLKGLARFFINLLGAGWAVATYFVVPILVVDGLGPVEAVKKSVVAIRKTWGEALVGHIGIASLHTLVSLVAVPIVILGVFSYDQQPEVGAAFIAFGVIIIIVGALIVSTLSAILRAALYVYAIEGQVPMNFDSRLIRDAFQPDDR